jgi:alkylresorcinol/alkylpyrone synthase
VVRAALTAIATALPAKVGQDEPWERFFADHFAHDRRARRILRGAGVETRNGTDLPFEEDVSGWGTKARMRRFREEALPLGVEAVRDALARAGLVPADVGLLAVVSCMGYATPGVDVLLARRMGMDAGTQRLHVGHMGCHAALPALAAVCDTAVARGRTGVLLCVELPACTSSLPPTKSIRWWPTPCSPMPPSPSSSFPTVPAWSSSTSSPVPTPRRPRC